MAIVGYRLNMDGPGTESGKIGYVHILTGTWNDIQDATFGWSTFVPPTYMPYGDAGAHRGVITNDSCLVMVQLQGGTFYRMTPAELASVRSTWIQSGKESMQYRPMQTLTFPDRIILTNTTYSTLYKVHPFGMPQRDSIATLAIGAIPVISVVAQMADAGGTDTAWIKLTDKNDLTMLSNGDSLVYQWVDGLTGVLGSMTNYNLPWKTYFPTRLRDASGSVVLGQFERPAMDLEIRAKSSHSSIIESIIINIGFIYK
jgi:hypothetical protein